MVKKLTNKELVENMGKLNLFQSREQKYMEGTGKKLLTGHFDIAYAINKTKGHIEQALKPYNKTLEEMLQECNSEEAKQKGVVKIRDDKKDVWENGMKQLQEEETEVDIHMIKLTEIKGIDFDSTDLSCLEFMIE